MLDGWCCALKLSLSHAAVQRMKISGVQHTSPICSVLYKHVGAEPHLQNSEGLYSLMLRLETQSLYSAATVLIMGTLL